MLGSTTDLYCRRRKSKNLSCNGISCTTRMRIGIDARFYGPSGKGLGRYTQKLIEHLEKIDTRNEYFIFLKKENFGQYQPGRNNFKKVLADYKWYTFSEQINMSRLLDSYKLNLVHFPHFNVPVLYRKKYVVTIHDLILLHYPTVRNTTLPSVFYFFKYFIYRLVIRYALKKSQTIVTVSQFTKEDILKNYPKIEPKKIAVAYEAADNFLSATLNSDEKLKKYGIMRPYLLYVGNAYPHKNLERLVRDFGVLKAKTGGKENLSDLSLVLVGKKDFFYQKLADFVAEKSIKNVHFAGFVKDEDLEAVYQNARALVFPSLYEGFGLPPLEAMKLGIPVAASNVSSIPEILGDAALYFDPKKEGSLADALKEIVEDDDLREKLVAKGRIQASKYNWNDLAKKTLAVYESV